MSLINDNITSEGILSGDTLFANLATITDLVVTNITGASTTDYYVTGGTFSSGTLTLNRNGLSDVTITGFTSGGGSGTLTGSGVSNQVAFWTDLYGLSSNNNLYWDNTNERLGIGTTTPSKTLHVSGDTLIQGIISGQTFTITSVPTNNNNNTRILSRNSTTGNIESVTGVTFGTGTNNYVTKWNSTSGLTTSLIGDNGIVVTIGTLSPSAYSTSYLAIGNAGAPAVKTYGLYTYATNGIYAAGTNIGVDATTATDSTGIAVRGTASAYYFGGGNPKGGYFSCEGGAENIGAHMFASSNVSPGGGRYAVQLEDGSEGVGKFLYSVTTDGKANWTNNLTGTTVTILSTPTLNNTNTNFLTRNSTTGEIERSTPANSAFYAYGIGFAQSIGNYLT